MVKFSLRQAADEVGASKSTILRAIQKGRLSAGRGDNGQYTIDPAELFRVYGEHNGKGGSADEVGQDAPAVDSSELESKLANLQSQLTKMDERIDDLQSQLDFARQIQVQTSQSLVYSQKHGFAGWWSRLWR